MATTAAAEVAAEGLRQSQLVGALLVPPRRVAAVRAALPEGWERRGRSVCAHRDPSDERSEDEARRVAVHVSAGAAAALADADRVAQLPSELGLQSGEVLWRPGLRLGSAACGGPRGRQCASAIYNLRHAEPSAAAAAARAQLAPTPEASTFRFVELFAGIGGFRLGLEAQGGRCVFASELDTHACATYHANFAEVPFGDITEIDVADIPPHDILTAGFPCQSFSKAGSVNEDGGAGLGDENGQLFFEVVRVLEGCRPRGFILENVAELQAHEGGHTYSVVVAALEAAGYTVRSRVINALALLPQQRERLFIVGVRRGDRAAAAFSWAFSWTGPAPEAERSELTESSMRNWILDVSPDLIR